MSSLLDRLLAPGALTAHFQPILDLSGADGRVDYVEGLLRVTIECTLPRPEVLFSYARRKHAETALDHASVRAVLMAARGLPGHYVVGVNVHASTLAAETDFVDLLQAASDEAGIPLSRVLIEVVEQGLPRHTGALQASLATLRAAGVRVALDDFGTGQSNFDMLLECAPTVLKIDRRFVRGADADARQRAALGVMSGLARSVGACAVAEGVETLAELEAVRASNIDRVQGFLFSHPVPAEALARDARLRDPRFRVAELRHWASTSA